MKKGIAIHIILLLVVGLVAAGIIIYLVYSTTTGTTLSQEACRAKAISYCTTCSVSNWKSTITAKEASCTHDYWTTGWTSISDCDDANVRKFCEELFIGKG